MTDVQQRALDLLNESRIAFGLAKTDVFFRDQTPENEALCRALERQEPAMTSELRPAVLMHTHDDEPTEFEEYRNGAGCLTQDDKDAGWTETPLYILEAVRAEQAAELAKWKALAETLADHLDSAVETLRDAEVCNDSCYHCNEARQALTSYKEQRDA